MVVKEYKKHAGVYKVQTFRTTHLNLGIDKVISQLITNLLTGKLMIPAAKKPLDH